MKRLVMGIAIGAGAMYLLDPDKGAERRGRLLGFYGENKDTFQEYAQSAASTAVTVGQTVGNAAEKAADTAIEITGKAKEKAETSSKIDKVERAAAAMANGGSSGETNVDTLLENRNTSRKSKAEEAPGMGGSLSS